MLSNFAVDNLKTKSKTTTMLYRFIIDNFCSFEHATQFDMFPNKKRETLSSHVYVNNGIGILKCAAIYGPNGGGKSNFVKAFTALYDIVSGKITQDKMRYWVQHNRFRLPTNDKPIDFLIEFSVDSNVYIYQISIGSEGVTDEHLYLSGVGKEENESVFSRKGLEFEFNFHVEPAISNVIKRQIADNPFLSILGQSSSLHLVDNEIVLNAYKWIADKMNVKSVFSPIPDFIDYFSNNSNFAKFVNDTFASIGIGTTEVTISEIPFADWIMKRSEGEAKALKEKAQEIVGGSAKSIANINIGQELPLFYLTQNDGILYARELIFRQKGINGFVGDMEIDTQSNGTLRVLSLLPVIYNVVNYELTMIVDEIDNGIHPKLLKALIKLFMNSESKGQLIFTTHDNTLMDQQTLLRPDEIWFVDKKDGVSEMYSLNDFRIHNTMSAERGYRENRFGANPVISL